MWTLWMWAVRRRQIHVGISVLDPFYIRYFFHDCQKCTSLMVLMFVNVNFALVKLDKHATFEIIICQT